jgi:N-formylglutamate amidohydrolase
MLDEPALEAELLILTDAHTDDLFGSHAKEGDAVVTFPVSRLVVDPERFQDDSVEVMARIGMGVVYERTSSGAPLRDAPSCEEREALIQRFYEPHHEQFSLATESELSLHGRALILDCHSFPAAPLPYELDQDPNRPDICIGTDEYHTPQALVSAAQQAVADEGLTCRINRPFAGTLVPATYWQCDKRVSSIMIEVNRNLYMDESTGERSAGYERCKDVVGRIVERVREAGTR